eukprot:jgi/Ulvmu1/9389/UM051_0016.1
MMVDADAEEKQLQSPGLPPGSPVKEQGPSEAHTRSHSTTAGDVDAPKGAALTLDGSGSDDDHFDDHAIPARNLSEEEQQQMRNVLRTSPEFSMAMDFLETFEAVLKVTTEFTVNSLEDELINSTGTEAGALRGLHMELMRGVSPFSRLNEASWTTGLCRLSRAYFAVNPEDNPFYGTGRGQEAHAYARFTAEQRCLLLRVLCDLRVERQDARDLIDLGQLTGKAQQRLHAAEHGDASDPIIYEPDDFTRQPLGEDEEERQYWLHDLRPGGLRLCREALPTEEDAEAYLIRALAAAARVTGGRSSGGGNKKGRKGGPPPCLPLEDLGPMPWETIATTMDDIDTIGAKLVSSRHKQDRSLGVLLCKQVADVRAEEAARTAAREAETLKELRREAQLQAGRDRSLRQRKPVDYTFTDTFLCMNRAIQGSGMFGAVAPSRRHGLPREPPSRLEPRAHPSTRAGARIGTADGDPDGTPGGPSNSVVAAEAPPAAAPPSDMVAAPETAPPAPEDAAQPHALQPAAPEPVQAPAPALMHAVAPLADAAPVPTHAVPVAAQARSASPQPARAATPAADPAPAAAPRRRAAAARQTTSRSCSEGEGPATATRPRRRESRPPRTHSPTPPPAARPPQPMTAADAVAEAACRGTVTLAQRRASTAQAETAAEGTAAAALAEMAAGRRQAFPAAPAGTALGIPACTARHVGADAMVGAGPAGGVVDGVAVLRDSNHARAGTPVTVAAAAEAGGADAVAAAAVGARVPREAARRRPHVPAAADDAHAVAVSATAHTNARAYAPPLVDTRDGENGMMAAAALGAENGGGLFVSGWGRKKRRHAAPVADAPAAKMLREGLPPLAPERPIGR